MDGLLPVSVKLSSGGKKLFDKTILRIINAINIPVIVTDESGIITARNNSAVVFFHKDILPGTEITGVLPAVLIRGNKELLSLKDGETSYFFDVPALVNGKSKETDVDVVLFENGSGRSYICTIKDITIYSELMNSINKFSTIVEGSPASVLITDVSGNIEFLNTNFQQLTGYSYEELIGTNINILRSSFHKQEYRQSIRAVLKAGETWKGELLNVSKNGSHYWVLATISPIFNKNNEISNYISIQEDITYLKKIEEELKQSEEKFRVLFETLPEGIVVTDLSGMIIQVNRAFLDIHGFSTREKIVGKSIYDISDNKVTLLLHSLFETAEKNGYSEIGSYEVLNKEKLYVEIQAALMKGEKGPLGFVVLTGDNTSRRNAETALRESEARNRALIEAVPDIMFRVNNEGVYLDKMLGNKISEVFPESIAVDAVRYISEAVKTREIQIFEYPVVASGRNEFYESRFIAIEDDEVLIILRNVTEKHTAMMQIEDARRDAEFANRSKSEFLANMSHEIRTPLNSITGFIELLMRSSLNDDQKEYLGIIKKSASNLLGIINDILDFSKIESHKLELHKVEFNPFTEFESVVRLFNVKAKEKKMRFFSFIDPRIPEGVISDPLRIKQVISNLLSNAIKFTPEDGLVIIEINLSRNKDGFCLINFSVADSGIGIPDRKQKQIFDAFVQADSSITRHYGGTGLGLSISSNLVRLLGSEIVLESVMGVGSKFYFTVECEVSIDTAPADFIKNSGIKACVLTGSPDDHSCKNIESYLSACGCDVEVCTDFASASREECDVIFMIKPSFNIHSLSVNALGGLNQPVVVVSDRYDADDYSPEFRKMFYDVLYHPLTPDLVFKALSCVADLREPEKIISGEDDTPLSFKFSGRVLVGEDNSINQKLMMLLLKDYGLEVDLAGNGLGVYEKFLNVRYDLILMDINMPVADGLETSHMIRDYEKENNAEAVPIVALTAKALKGDKEIIAESGMNDYLTKPVEMDKLEAVLLKYLPAGKVEKCSDDVQKSERSDSSAAYYDLKGTAAELKIPVNVLLNIGRDFFEDTLKVVDEIRAAADNSSYKEISAFSHKVRGASANLRFGKLSEFFLELEEKSSQGEKNFDYSGKLDNIINEMELLKSYF
jgi:PAS domain S-box-containing protein